MVFVLSTKMIGYIIIRSVLSVFNKSVNGRVSSSAVNASLCKYKIIYKLIIIS